MEVLGRIPNVCGKSLEALEKVSRSSPEISGRFPRGLRKFRGNLRETFDRRVFRLSTVDYICDFAGRCEIFGSPGGLREDSGRISTVVSGSTPGDSPGVAWKSPGEFRP